MSNQAGPEPHSNPNLEELTEEGWQLWRRHPTTVAFLQYLRDCRAQMVAETLERWESGALRLVDEQELRARCAQLAELQELGPDAMRRFYEGQSGLDSQNRGE